MVFNGYPEKILRVNLTTSEINSEQIPEKWLDQYIGGKGLGAAYLYSELEEGVDALSPQNKLLFMLGPLVGIAPGCSRYCVTTKSPHTGTFLDSYSGGHFPAQLRFSLVDHAGIIFEGQAEEPVYLKVDNGNVKLHQASDLKGEKISRVCEYFEGYKVAAIGPAGENLVKYSTISSDEGSHHAGRGGAGAVMGSKNLKAVVVKGDKLEVPEVKDLRKTHLKRLADGEDTKWAREGGTPQIIDWTNETGTLPTRNWTKGSYEKTGSLNIDVVRENTKSRDACYLCPVSCGFNLKFKEGAFKGLETGWGPEYESIAMNGANTEIDDLSAVAKIADLCDELGMDTITTGNVLGWAMECSDKGLIDYDIDFGDYKKAIELVKKVANRDGIGDLLAEGTREAAKEYGEQAKEAAVQVKGLELPGYDPRGSFSMALAYATSDRGGCHMRAFSIGSDALGGDRDPYSTEGHAEAVIQLQNENALLWSLIACDTTGYTLDDSVDWLNSLRYEVDRGSLEKAGERIWNLTRLFNIREGFSRSEDSIPERLKQPLKRGGPADGNLITDEEFNRMLDEYYEMRGWRQDGRPTEGKIEELDLKDI